MDRTRTLGLLALAPALVMAAFFLVGDVTTLMDPCHTWGDTRTSLSPTAECPGVSSTSQTLANYLLLAVAVKGSILATSALAFFGFARRNAVMTVGAAWLFTLISLPLMLGFAGIPVIVTAALILVATRQTFGFIGAALVPARALALLITIGGVVRFAGAFVSGVPAFILSSFVLLAVPGLMIWATWPPRDEAAPA